MARSYKPKKKKPAADAPPKWMPVYLGARAWQRIHGTGKPQPAEAWASAGWKWQPQRCYCTPPHYIASDVATREGKS